MQRIEVTTKPSPRAPGVQHQRGGGLTCSRWMRPSRPRCSEGLERCTRWR